MHLEDFQSRLSDIWYSISVFKRMIGDVQGCYEVHYNMKKKHRKKKETKIKDFPFKDRADVI